MSLSCARFTLSLMGLTMTAAAQDFRFGAKAGVPLTTYFETGTAMVRGGVVEYTSETRRYTAGPSIEWRLTPRVAVEVDALYRRVSYVRNENTTVSGVTTNSSLEVTANSWDFPIMAKRRWESGVGPYVAGGFALRYLKPSRARGISTVQTAQGTVTTPIDSDNGVISDSGSNGRVGR